MKKILLVFGLALFSSTQINAQCDPVSSLEESFGGSSLPECWTGSHGYPNIMPGDNITFYSGNSGSLDIYLVSPEITEFNGQQTLTFTVAGTSMSPVLQVGTLTLANDFSTFENVGDEIALGAETTFTLDVPASTTQKFIAFKFSAGGSPHAAGTLDEVIFQSSNSPCSPINSLNESFGGSSLPECWTGSHSYPNIMPGDNITFYSGNSGSLDIYLVSPEITEFNGQQTLTFTVAGTSMSPVLQVGTLTLADDFSTFENVGDEIALGAETTFTLDVPASTQKFIAFKFSAGGFPHAAGTLDEVIFQTTASVITTENIVFKLYPNPVSSVLNIEGNFEIKSIAIFDITGRKVLTSVSKNIDVSSLNNGTYILNITTEKGTSQSKFIKK